MLLNWEMCVQCGLSGSDAEPVFPWRPAVVRRAGNHLLDGLSTPRPII